MSAQSVDPIIQVRDVHKIYRIYTGYGRGWLKSILLPWMDRDRFSRAVHALRGIDLTVGRGEVVGILGRNGAGKSTLLRIISGLSRPTRGSSVVQGETRALLSLGVGFNPKFTGRENVYFGSLAMGITRRLVARRVGDILDFAELRGFEDVPIQFYSNGMRSRLAAAVAFQDAAEVLIIDEALAAGDGYFISKCRERIAEICRSGSTVLFVTHGPGLVSRMCSRALIMMDGRIAHDGEPSEVVATYRRMLLVDPEQGVPQGAGPSVPPGLPVHDESDEMEDAAPGAADGAALGTGAIRVDSAVMLDGSDRETDQVLHDRPCALRIRFRTRRPIPGPVRFFAQLWSDEYGIRVTELGNVLFDPCDRVLRPTRVLNDLDGAYELRLTLPRNPLGGGRYYWSLAFAPPGDRIPWESPALFHCQVLRTCLFRSLSSSEDWALGRVNIVEPEAAIEVHRLPDAGISRQWVASHDRA
ncbi:MAG: ATP-binding cassette domain-containing protein [Phycisphaeraceae bacterium]|nr:ATP-binding cassette domain-containing protein [Phycisphaeraceae bacterium]